MPDQPKIPPIPRLSSAASPDDVQQKKVESRTGKSFALDYISWARTTELLREHAPGWLAVMVPNPSGEHVHRAPNGSGYLMIAFRHEETGYQTPPVPHALMDNRNEAVPGDQIDARDIADGFVRGLCKSAAVTFGLAWQLWSKDDPMTSPPAPTTTRKEPKSSRAAPTTIAKPSREDQDEVEPFEQVMEADQAIRLATSHLELSQIAARVKASSFRQTEAEAIRQTWARRRDELAAGAPDRSE